MQRDGDADEFDAGLPTLAILVGMHAKCAPWHVSQLAGQKGKAFLVDLSEE